MFCPRKNLILLTRVFSGQQGLNDERIGNGFGNGFGKAVSSEHRMTWIKAEF